MHEQAQAKRLRAEKLLAKIEASLLPVGPDYDKETITDEERVMFRKVGLRMKPYLPLGEKFSTVQKLLYSSNAKLTPFYDNLQVYVVFLMVLSRICICIGNTEN